MSEKSKICLLLSLSLAISALILFVPANLFPFMTIELYGQKNESTIWEGVVSLWGAGEYFVSVVVFLASLVIPFIKLILLVLVAARVMKNSKVSDSDIYVHRALEILGRWSMLDVFLVAILVAVLKLADLVNVQVGFGSFLFLAVVLLSLISAEALTKVVEKSEESL